MACSPPGCAGHGRGGSGGMVQRAARSTNNESRTSGIAAAACAAPAMASQMTAITQMNANGRRGALPSRATPVRGSAPDAAWERACPVGRSAVRSRSSPQVRAEYAPSVRSWNSSRSIRPATYASRSTPAASSRSRSEARIASSLVISVFPSSPASSRVSGAGPVDFCAFAADAVSCLLLADHCGHRRRALSFSLAVPATVSSCRKGDKRNPVLVITGGATKRPLTRLPGPGLAPDPPVYGD
jgi:hypothetical protein